MLMLLATTWALAGPDYEEMLFGMDVDDLLLEEQQEFAILVRLLEAPEPVYTFFPSGLGREAERVLVEVQQTWNGSVEADTLWFVTDVEAGVVGLTDPFLLFVTPRVGGATYSSAAGTVLPYATWPAASDTVVLNRRGNSFRIIDGGLYTSQTRTPLCVVESVLTNCDRADRYTSLTNLLPSSSTMVMKGVQ